MKKNNGMPWSKVVRLNNRGLKLLYRRYPQMILSRLFYVVWTSLTPYTGIYLSALIVEELAGARSAGRLRFLVLTALLLAVFSALVSAFLHKWKETQNQGLWFKIKYLFSEKLYDMDYVDLDKTETEELLSRIEQNQNSGDWGIRRIMDNYEALLSGVLTILGGISMTVSLFVSAVPESAGAYTLLNEPLVLVFIIAAMLGITYAAPALSNKAGSYFAVHADIHRMENLLFSFFGILGYRREIAADVRMYEQEKMCDRHNVNKKGPFGSGGMFAKLARGPIGLYSAASASVSMVFTGVAYLFVCLKAWAGAFGLGAVTQYIASITRVSGGVSELISTFGKMRNNGAFLEQVFAFLDIPNQMYQGSLTVEKRRDLKYEVEFRNVSFQYPGSDSYALKHVNMKFKIGRRLAVVGMNGSGKTTFIKLLCRLYDPTEGEILLNGIDIRKYHYAEYMGIFSIVFQDFKLFSLKLGENVAAGASYEEQAVKDALQKAGFADRLAELPEGLDTYLYKDYNENGVNVSGGEGQKIAIARALYKKAPFIIMDEPTAALDPIAEAEIYERFNELVGGRTAIYISHRLSSCKFCDEILVFHEGRVVQQGSHEVLVNEKNGKYYELWQAQAQYYAE